MADQTTGTNPDPPRPGDPVPNEDWIRQVFGSARCPANKPERQGAGAADNAAKSAATGTTVRPLPPVGTPCDKRGRVRR